MEVYQPVQAARIMLYRSRRTAQCRLNSPVRTPSQVRKTSKMIWWIRKRASMPSKLGPWVQETGNRESAHGAALTSSVDHPLKDEDVEHLQPVGSQPREQNVIRVSSGEESSNSTKLHNAAEPRSGETKPSAADSTRVKEVDLETAANEGVPTASRMVTRSQSSKEIDSATKATQLKENGDWHKEQYGRPRAGNEAGRSERITDHDPQGFDHLLSDKIIIDVCRLKQVSIKWKEIAKKLQVDCKTFSKKSSDETKLKRVFDAWKVNQKPPFTMTSLLNVLRSREVGASNVACQFEDEVKKDQAKQHPVKAPQKPQRNEREYQNQGDHQLLPDDVVGMVCSTIPCTKWVAIAKQLQLEEDAIKALQDSDITDQEKFKAVFLQWNKKENPPYTLSVLVQVLKSKAVDEFHIANQLAQRIEHKEEECYTPEKPHIDVTSARPDTPIGVFMTPVMKKHNYRPHPAVTLFPTPLHQCVRVFFHVLLKKNMWEWGDNSKMCIRFYWCPEMGDGNWDCGELQVYKLMEQNDDSVCVMRGCVPVPKSVLLRGVCYKYCVYPDRTRSDYTVEDFKTDSYNYRFLQLSNSGVKFDFQVFPEGGLWEKFKSSFGISRDIHIDSSILALRTYLPICYTDVCNANPVWDVVGRAIHLERFFTNLSFPKMYSSKNRRNVTLQFHLKRFFIEWIEQQADDLNKDPAPELKKIQICFLYFYLLGTLGLQQEITLSCIKALLHAIQPPHQPEAFQQVVQMLWSPEQALVRSKLQSMLQSVCKTLIEADGMHYEWMSGLLLLHVLSSKEFEKQLEQSDSLRPAMKKFWTVVYCGLDPNTFSKRIPSNYRFAEKTYELLHPCFPIDRLLFYAWIKTCPISDYEWISINVPNFASMGCCCLSDLLNEQFANQRGRPTEVYQCINALLDSLSSPQFCSSIQQEHLYLCSGVKEVCRKVIFFFGSTKLVIAAARLYLKGMDILSVHYHYPREKILELIVQFSGNLGKWVTHVYSHAFNTSSDESELWSLLLNCKVCVTVKECWQAKANEIIHQRIDELDLRLKLDMMQNPLETYLEKMVTDSVMKDIDDGVQVEQGWISSFFLNQNAGTMLGRILIKSFPENSVSVTQLLQWSNWPSYLQLLTKQEIKLPQPAISLCQKAIFVLSTFTKKVVEGTLSLSDLKEVLRFEQPVIINSVQQFYQVDFEQGTLPDWEQFVSGLHSRVKEYNAFIERKEKLSRLISHCQNVAPDAVAELNRELHPVYEQATISSICSIQECLTEANGCAVKIVFSTLNVAKEVEEMLQRFFEMTNDSRPSMFVDLWENAKEKYIRDCEQNKSKPSLTFPQVATQIWAPVYEKSKQIVQELSSLIMPLAKVREYPFPKEKNKLEERLRNLCIVVDTCRSLEGLVPIGEQWVREAVDRILKFYTLCKYAAAADTLKELKEVLNLSGNFSIVKTLSEQVSRNVSNEVTLQTVDESAVETGDVLKDIADDPSRQKCLKTFCMCTDLLKWLQKETTNVGQLQSFVVVAHQTESEDHTRDLLTHLHTVGTAFAPLIYDLPSDAGCEVLVGRCKGLWEALEDTPNLAKLAASCNQQVGQYQRIKETLGEVRATTIKYMEEINLEGVYEISASADGKMLSKADESIRLRLRTDREAGQKVFDLDKLQELQSKLVLVCGDKQEMGGGGVDKFLELLSKVQQVSGLLFNLQRAGNVKYLYFTVKFGCAIIKVAELEELIEKMTHDYEVWQKQLGEHRKIYQHLNYFTSEQLLYLRHDLAKFSSLDHQELIAKSTLDPKLIALLQSVTPLPTTEVVQRALKHACQITTQEPDTQKPEKVQESAKLTTAKLNLCLTEISEQQQVILDMLLDEAYPKKLILRAIHTTESEDCDVIRDWCMDNEHLYANEEQEIDTEPVEQNEAAAEVTAAHPHVQELVDDDYSLQVAIKAVQESGGDLEKAREVAQALESGIVQSISGIQDDEEWSLPSMFRSTPLQCAVKTIPEGEYLNIEQLGEVLQELSSSSGKLTKQRKGRRLAIETGKCNLIVIDPGCVWKALLSLYMPDKDLPLPSIEEVLICSETTTTEEVTLLWYRAVNDKPKNRIFCLVHAEKLPYSVCNEALQNFELITQGCPDFRLVVICADEDHGRSFCASRLSAYQRKIHPLPLDKEIVDYLHSHFSTRFMESGADSICSSVHLVYSTRPGMGKTLHINRLFEQFAEKQPTDYLCVPIHGPDVTADNVIKFLLNGLQGPEDTPLQVIHFDISHSVVHMVDSLLFSILILGSLSNKDGDMWRQQSKQICVVECTLSHLQSNDLSPLNWHMKRSKGSRSEPELPSSYSLLSLLPQTLCIPPNACAELYAKGDTTNHILMDMTLFKEKKIQRVYQYLRRIKDRQDLDKFEFNPEVVDSDPDLCLRLMLEQMIPRKFPSWSEVENFIQFLDAQLSDCETSIFCNEIYVGDTLPGFRKFVVEFMVMMSKEFTSPSLKIACKEEEEEEEEDEDIEENYKVDLEKAWTTSEHPYLFFNQDHNSFTFMGLWVDENGSLINIKDRSIMKEKFMPKALRAALKVNRINFEEDYDSWNTKQMIEKLGNVLGIEEDKLKNPDDSYVLTVDNVMKMLAIHMRFRCNIPVILMGETGCGKTRLLKYLCDLQGKTFNTKNMLCLKVHGGTSVARIQAEVERAQILARENAEKFGDSVYTVLFFDEANTTDALGLIKEVMCDRRILGKPLGNDLKFAAACNPYRRHSEEMVKKLESAGLGFFLREDENIPMLGKIPLRRLVYRVLPLPPSMNQYIYDFGAISGKTEDKYINKIVSVHIKMSKLIPLPEEEMLITAVHKVLSGCQRYMREQKDECSFVSLRDIVRAMILFEWFLDKLTNVEVLQQKLSEKEKEEQERIGKGIKPVSNIVKALIYSIAVSYHARLSVRERFEEQIVKYFEGQCDIPESDDNAKAERFRREITRIETVFLDAMIVPNNIAHNAALRENVFMMTVCIENRLPLFLVGKPGSSKSLAKSIVVNSMSGRQSSSSLLKHFKSAQLFSYQCSQFSTSDSIIEIFTEAKEFQDYKKDCSKFVAVVVLDEVGLAEDSPGLPLKVLHPYLEDGTAGLVSDEEDIRREERVGFIGISNWALDAAKMNRGILVTRCAPDNNELLKSAEGISAMVEDTSLRTELKNKFASLAEMYFNICKKQEKVHSDSGDDDIREFFGLRDFYTLIKMLCWRCIELQSPPTKQDLRHAILRNFSGHVKIDPLKELPDIEMIDEAEDGNESLSLVKASLQTVSVDPASKDTPLRENRYLLFLTENQSALHILQTHLLRDKTPFVLYGSSFPKDQEYTQVCMNINKIKICMERGDPVVLLNLENIYESLYDVLNQCYTELPGGRYVDMGLRSHRIKCRVDVNFRLIIIAERDTVTKKFATALINRLEKHFILSETILSENEHKMMAELMQWVSEISTIDRRFAYGKKFKEADSFVGYQKDTAASIILHATRLIEDKILVVESTDDEELSFEEKVLMTSHRLLLQTVAVDGMARLNASVFGNKYPEKRQRITDFYFEEQHHFSLALFLQNQLNADKALIPEGGALLQVTTYGLLLNNGDIPAIVEATGIESSHVKQLMLQEFDTEMDFCHKIGEVFTANTEHNRLLIIQCTKADENIDLIACARYRVMDERKKKETNGVTHILFIVQLPRVNGGTSFSSFQGGQWVSAHIDDLHVSPNIDKVLRSALNNPLHMFFKSLVENPDVPLEFNPCFLIRDTIHLAVASVISSEKICTRMETVIFIILKLIPEKNPGNKELQHSTFVGCLLSRLYDLLAERDALSEDPELWAVNAALDGQKLQNSFTFVNLLSRLLSDVIKKLLSYMIPLIDLNSNLDLIDTADEQSILCQLWLSAFLNETFFQLRYTDFATSGSNTVEVSKQRYNCQFPFSWEMIDQVDAVCTNVIPSAAGGQNVQELLVATLLTHPVEQVLKVIPKESSHDFYERYLNDFVSKLSLQIEDKENGNKLVYDAIHLSATKHLPSLKTPEQFPDVLQGIAAIHVGYRTIQSEIHWFTELTKLFPELPSILKKQLQSADSEVVFHLFALKEVIQITSPTAKKDWDNPTLREWVRTLHSCKNTVQSLLSAQVTEGEQAISLIDTARKNWQKTQAVLLFTEHLILKIPAVFKALYAFPKRIDHSLANVSFTEATVLKKMFKHVKALVSSYEKQEEVVKLACASCENTLRPDDTVYLPCPEHHMFCNPCIKDAWKKGERNCIKCKVFIPLEAKTKVPESIRRKLEDYGRLQQNCCDFFMEFVTDICSSTYMFQRPDKSFVKELMRIVFSMGESDEYKELFPVEESKESSCPVIRSFLLQFLLEISPEEVKEHIQKYLDFVHEKAGRQFVVNDMDLYLLCIKCMEDRFYKKYIEISQVREKLAFTNQHMLDVLPRISDDGEMIVLEKKKDVHYLELVAKLRFGLCVAADLLYTYYWTSDNIHELNHYEKEALEELLASVKLICHDRGVKTEPSHFLVKQIVRQYGFPCLEKLCQQEIFEKWIMPAGISNKQDRGLKGMDMFALYGSEYASLRTTIVYNPQEMDIDEFQIQDNQVIPAVLAVFRRLTYQKGEDQRALQSSDLKIKIANLKQFLSEHKLITPEMTDTMLGKPDEESVADSILFVPWKEVLDSLLGSIVVHIVTVLAACKERVLLTPLVKILTEPASLEGMYVPTMADDPVDVIASSLKGGNWGVESYIDTHWKCPNGHSYFIQDCGRPVVGTIKCFCGASIGGKDEHVARDDNTKVDAGSTQTKRGHCLGNPRDQSPNPSPQRDLQPISHAVLRLILHATCSWVALSGQKTGCEGLVGGVTPAVELRKILDFFWHHLERDFEILCNAIGKSFDEAALLVHIVVQNILKTNHIIDGLDVSLSTISARMAWENAFDNAYIKPTVENLEASIQKAQQTIMNDSGHDHGKLFQVVYEKDTIQRGEIEAHIWSYRPRISLKHLVQSMQREKTATEDLSALKEFLKEEPLLKAVQYLPDIVVLQRQLYDMCNHRLDLSDAETITMRKFLSTHISKEHQHDQFRGMVRSFCCAWNLVKKELLNFSSSPVPPQYGEIVLTEDQPVGFFIPAEKGPGLCSTSLSIYLARLQNDFIESSWSKVGDDKFDKNRYRLQLSRLQSCHVIDYEQQLIHVVMTHCKYSLKIGFGDDVTYDYASLEKHILDRFVHGKPLIDVDIPLLAFKSDILKTTVFSRVRKAIPQEKLTRAAKQEIRREVLLKQCLQESIDMLTVAMGFLHTTSANSEIMLSRYVKNLRMGKEFPSKIQQYCQLKHVLSLWRVLNIEQARQLTQGNEDPFPNVSSDFKTPLSDDEKKTLDTSLTPYDLDMFMEAFYEFIVTYITIECQSYEAEEELVETYETVREYHNLDLIPGFAEKFPKQFNVSHVVEIWKYTVIYQMKQRRKGAI